MNYRDIFIVNRILNQALDAFELTPRENRAVLKLRAILRASWRIQTSSREDFTFAGSALANRSRRKQTSREVASSAARVLALKKLRERRRYRLY